METIPAIMKIMALTVMDGILSDRIDHQIETRDELSRTVTSINFSACEKPVIFSDSVGGEHINQYRIAARKGEKFLTTFISRDGNADTHVSGDNVLVKVENRPNNFIRAYYETDKHEDAEIELSVYAHSHDEYLLEVRKVSEQ